MMRDLAGEKNNSIRTLSMLINHRRAPHPHIGSSIRSYAYARARYQKKLWRAPHPHTILYMYAVARARHQ